MRMLEDVVSAEDAAWLRAFRRDLAAALPGGIEAVVLFGSRARGDARHDSDYDVAVVLTGDLADDPTTQSRLSRVTFDYKVDGHDLQALPFDGSEFAPPRSEIAMHILADGVAIQ
jgi:predicted nucleotidyltransferase